MADFSSNPISELPAGFVLLKSLSVLRYLFLLILNDVQTTACPRKTGAAAEASPVFMSQSQVGDGGGGGGGWAEFNTVLWIRSGSTCIRIHLADPCWECGSGSRQGWH